jgi:hypothetical protein
METRYIDVTFSTPEPAMFQGRGVFRVVVQVVRAEQMPLEIFGFQQTLLDAYTQTTFDEFAFVCSAYDLSFYPANAPNPTQSPAFFRKSGFDILLPGVAAATDFITEVRNQIEELVDTLNLLDTLTQETSLEYPGPDTDDEGSLGSLDSI